MNVFISFCVRFFNENKVGKCVNILEVEGWKNIPGILKANVKEDKEISAIKVFTEE